MIIILYLETFQQNWLCFTLNNFYTLLAFDSCTTDCCLKLVESGMQMKACGKDNKTKKKQNKNKENKVEWQELSCCFFFCVFKADEKTCTTVNDA